MMSTDVSNFSLSPGKPRETSEWLPKTWESDVLASRLLSSGRMAAPPSMSASSSGRLKGMAVPVEGGTAE